jgi:hypothetical protein
MREDPNSYITGGPLTRLNLDLIFESESTSAALHLSTCMLPVSKIKSQKEVTKAELIKVFLKYFCLVIVGSGSIPLTMDPDPGGPKTYGSDGSGFGSGSATLIGTVLNSKKYIFKKLIKSGKK